MSLQGKINKLPGVGFCFQSSVTDWNSPKIITHTWELVRINVSGMAWKPYDEAIGKPATCANGRVQCYLGDGVWFGGDMPDGASTKAISVDITEAPRPKAKTELRWYAGQWQKYLKTRGWVAA